METNTVCKNCKIGDSRSYSRRLERVEFFILILFFQTLKQSVDRVEIDLIFGKA